MPIFTESEGQYRVKRRVVKRGSELPFDQGTFPADNMDGTVTAQGTVTVLSPYEVAVSYTDQDTGNVYSGVYSEEEINALDLRRTKPARTVTILGKDITLRRERTARIRHDLVLWEPPLQRSIPSFSKRHLPSQPR